jgi:NAD(P)-dependent dehydrogenase (short-subunit alcohol dehydrogenase family)
MNLSVPAYADPVFQSDFLSPPDYGEETYIGTGRLQGLCAPVTGGGSGIRCAAVIAYAQEGASVAINYLPEEQPDAEALAKFLFAEGHMLELIPGDLMNETFCSYLAEGAASRLGGLDILVGNAS